MLTATQIAWGAGLIEGEGYITFNGPTRKTPMLGISMTDRDVVEKFHKLFASFRTRIYEFPPQKPGYKKQYGVKVTGHRAAGLMMTLYSFLGKRRRERIREVLDVWRSTRMGGARIKKEG